MKYLITLMLITACGSAPKETKDNGSVDDSIQKESAEPKREYAIVVDDKLPICDQDADQMLVYQRSTETFFTCDSREWLKISLKGKDGIDGKDGVSGTSGKDGEDAKPLASNLWLDPITDITWLIASPSMTLPNAVAACASPYRMPTTAEAITAVSHGILNNNAQTMWINYHETDSNAGMWINPSLTVSGASIATSPVKGTFCIQE